MNKPTISGEFTSPVLSSQPKEDNSKQLAAIDASQKRRLEHLIEVETKGVYELEMRLCELDGLYFMNWYANTYDPRNINETPPLPSYLPFDLCDRQVELWEWMDRLLVLRQDGAVKKSRGVGFTWMAACYTWHKWRWARGFKTTFASRKATEVDQIGNPDTIFEKIRLLYRGLPRWMLPTGFNPNIHDKQMLLVNPDNGNTIRGEGGDEIGRGGRSSLVILDEASRLEHADQIDAATSATADVRLWGSSLNLRNENNLFQRKYQSFPLERVFRFHYSQHPIWTPEKIRKKKIDVSDPEIWAAEFEIDDTYIAEDITIPAIWVASAIKLKPLVEKKREEIIEQINTTHAEYESLPAVEKITITGVELLNKVRDLSALRDRLIVQSSTVGVAGGDVGGGKAVSVIVAKFGPVITIPQAWTNPDTTETALKMIDYCVETTLPARADNWVPKIKTLRFDSVAIGQGVLSTMKRTATPGLIKVGVNVGEPASETKWADGRTSEEKFFNLKAEGWWLAREAFKKTYETVQFLEGNDEFKLHSIDELISLPNLPNNIDVQKLINQLSQPKWHRRENGKIQIEDKKQLSKRGIPSPDYADAFILTLIGGSKAEKWVAFSKITV